MAETRKLTAYEDAVLTILAREFSSTDTKESEAKIKKKLGAKKLGKYDQQRVDQLRRLKDAVQRGQEMRQVEILFEISWRVRRYERF